MPTETKPLALTVAEKFETLEHLTSMVAKGGSYSMLCYGPGGTGKTQTIEMTLKSLEQKYVLLRGYVSGTAFYNFLFKHRTKLIVIDDCDSVFKDKDGLNILKAVLETTEVRKVQWLTPSPLIEHPEFTFQGRIIFISNMSIENLSSHLEALVTRVHAFALNLSPDEALAKIRKIALKSDYKKSSKEDRLAVYNFLRKNKEKIPTLNLRHYIKAMDLYLFDKKEWRKIFMRCI